MFVLPKLELPVVLCVPHDWSQRMEPVKKVSSLCCWSPIVTSFKTRRQSKDQLAHVRLQLFSQHRTPSDGDLYYTTMDHHDVSYTDVSHTNASTGLLSAHKKCWHSDGDLIRSDSPALPGASPDPRLVYINLKLYVRIYLFFSDWLHWTSPRGAAHESPSNSLKHVSYLVGCRCV